MFNPMKCSGNQPMSQFEYHGGYLTVTDTSRWNFAWGFRRVIKRIDEE